MFNIIVKSLMKQGIRIKIIFIQMLIVFLALNVGFSISFSGMKFERDIKKFMKPNKEVKIFISVYSNNYDIVTKKYNDIYNDIKRNKLVQNKGAFIQYKVTSKEWITNSKIDNYDVNKLFVDTDALSLYNFEIQKGKKLDNNIIKHLGSSVPVLVGNSLSSKLPLNSQFTSKEIINGKMVEVNFKVVGIIKRNSLFWSQKQDSNNRLSNLDNTVIIPIAGSCASVTNQFAIPFFLGNSIVTEFTSEADMNKFIIYMKDTYVNSDCSIKFFSSQDLIKDKYDSNKTWLGIIFTFTLMLMILSTIGLIGVVLSYIEKRGREFGIRYVMGSSVKKLECLILGEVLIVFTFADMLSIIIYLVLSNVITSELLPNAKILPFALSILVSIFLGVMTSFIPILSIIRTSPAKLIKGEKR